MKDRREFLKVSAAVSLGAAVAPVGRLIGEPKEKTSRKADFPLVISTWPHGLPANEAAARVLNSGGKAIDAVEKGVRVPEGDPKVSSVGYGGLPDMDGEVTLDASIMNEKGEAGGVACLKNIKHPISVARLVMEETPHVLLVGEGALKFALSRGFKKENLLTREARKRWLKWKKSRKSENTKGHDTIGMLAIDKNGDISGACTTSGLAWKMPGRVGDSPIIGAGLYVDNEVGGATATGVGEAVMKTLGSFLIVEKMREGASPLEACKIAVKRIVEKVADADKIQVAFIALNKNGEWGAYSLKKGFRYALYRNSKNELISSDYFFKG